MLGKPNVEPGREARVFHAVINAGRDEDDVADLDLTLDAAAVLTVDFFTARYESAAAFRDDPHVDRVLVELRVVGRGRPILDVPNVDVELAALEHSNHAD